ncbi:hypothetical protein [Okeania sp. SIO2C2]|nr:hypothetical protein [Okeania sp. SIO2C2]
MSQKSKAKKIVTFDLTIFRSQNSGGPSQESEFRRTESGVRRK